jgi:AraC family transcriptional regulator, arabinose operon regulatory protein
VLLPPKPAHDNAAVPELVSDHFIQAEGYNTVRSRGTTTALLFFTRKGQGFMRSFRNNRENVHITNPGELVLWEAKQPQSYGTVLGSVWDFHWVHFHPKAHWRPLLQMAPVAAVRGVSTLQMSLDDLGTIDALFASIHRDTRMSSRFRQELALNSLERVLMLAQEQTGTKSTRAIDARVRVALERIASDPGKPHSVGALAKTAGLSPSRFAHLFAQETGRSVLETVIRLRLAQAERLLTLSSSSVSEIAFAVGFSSVSLFTRHFTRHYGSSPRKFRQSVPVTNYPKSPIRL